MKRVMIIILSIMLLVSCQPKDEIEVKITAETDKDQQPNDIDSQVSSTTEKKDPIESTEENTEVTDEIINNEDIVKGWEIDSNNLTLELDYKQPTYTVNSPEYNWNPDLSDLKNSTQYEGFSTGQLELLNKNGFVVLRESNQYPALMLHQGYENSEYDLAPLFITSDIVLHMYHTFYSESMKTLELTEYLPDLKILTEQLYNQVNRDYLAANDEVKAELKYVYGYIAVAAKLLDIKTDLPEEITEMVDIELGYIENHDGLNDSVVFDKPVDYSQYTLRGHYTLHEDLGKFFKTMMWYGQSGFQLTDKEITLYEGVTRACMLTHIMMENEENVFKWDEIYKLTKLYSGYSDDLNVFDMKAFMLEVYSNEHLDYTSYIDPKYKEAIDNEVINLRQPEIVGKFDDTIGNGMKVGLEFRLMGQRFTPDAYIMQNLMEPIVRPDPTAYDVMTALGSPLAGEILYENYITNQAWPGYDAKLVEMKGFIKTYEDWQGNLYNGWLWAIQATLDTDESKEGLPVFMQNTAWDYKTLTSALGSYAELKHDNVLYSKQPVAERGGGAEPDQPYHYIEPNVELYSRLLWLANYTKLNLEANEDIKPEVIEPINHMIELLSTFESVSIKELESSEVSDEEFATMQYIGGYIDSLLYSYRSQLNEQGIQVDQRTTSAIISDVATVLDPTMGDSYLEEATGMPYDIYVVCHTNGTSYLAHGYVFSYYEFTSFKKRLTNEDWEKMIGFEKNEEYNFTQYVGPAYLMTEKMPWTTNYVSEEPNNVKWNYDELIWGE